MHSAYSIIEPHPSHKEGLRVLWKEAFGDDDAFLDIFESTAFSAARCRCMIYDNQVVAALYWFDCSFDQAKVAYIYAVATATHFRGQGLCHALMQNTHQHLQLLGYTGALLAPATDTLFAFYKSIGYKNGTYINQISFDENTLFSLEEKEVPLRVVGAEEFQLLRRKYLPAGSILQENENIAFLSTQTQFFAGNNFLLTARIEDTHLYGLEFLGDTSLLSTIMYQLNCKSATIRTPGNEMPFTMYYPLKQEATTPKYFGFIFD